MQIAIGGFGEPVLHGLRRREARRSRRSEVVLGFRHFACRENEERRSDHKDETPDKRVYGIPFSASFIYRLSLLAKQSHLCTSPSFRVVPTLKTQNLCQ